MNLLRCRSAAVVACAFASPALVPAADARTRTWYVKAGAEGDGSRRAPFGTLAQVEAAAGPRERIRVLRSTRVLTGGIRLKPGQQLRGIGAPRLTNPDGDGVRLADGVTVEGLVIAGTGRGGIYGENVRRARIVRNDVSGHNRSCTRGFHIPPFNVPTMVPGVGLPISEGLHNGWAGIMLDADRGTTDVRIIGNRVHAAECGDGIDIRASGTSTVRATIVRNDVAELRQGEAFESVLAFGLQSRDRARLEAYLDGNTQAGLGNDEDLGAGPTGADSEGVFINPVGPSKLRATVIRNRYTHTAGRGGFSANGLEFVSMGHGASALVDVRDSTFSGTPGDVLEQLALGTGATLRMRLDRVVATRSTGFSGSGFGDTVIIPGNNADCLIAASGGAGNTVDLAVRRSVLTDCANNGLTFGSAVANGTGPSAALRLDVADSRITGNRGGNLRIGNVAGLDRLAVKVEHTNLSDSRGATSTPANLTVEDLGTTRDRTIDLGGGALGSAGGNCLGGGRLAAAIVGASVTARHNWWGQPGRPGLRAPALGGTLDDADPLGAPPRSC